MYLNVTGAGVEVRETANLRDLHVSIDGIDDAAAQDLLRRSDFGDLDGDHCWLLVDQLRTAEAGDADWLSGFTAMVQYAADHGWTKEDGTRIRAHVVRS